MPGDTSHAARSLTRRTVAALAVIALLVLVIPAIRRHRSPDTFSISGGTMGTFYTVKVVLPPAHRARPTREDLENTRRLVDEALDEVNRLMSSWDPDSELSRLNRHPANTPFTLSEPTFGVLALAQRVSEATGGAFDVTVGPLVDAWGFGPEGTPPEAPPREELAGLREQVGYGMLALDPDARTVTKARPDVRCDLGGIAKGYGVDRVAEVLAEQGHEHFMVEIGGEVRTRGHNAEGFPWRIAIERPAGFAARAIHRVVGLSDAAMATSGDYRNFYMKDGKRLSHTIDPRTGRPVDHALASVTVVADTCAEADAFATALMVLGPDEGRALAERERLAACFLIRHGEDFQERTTSAFDELPRD